MNIQPSITFPNFNSLNDSLNNKFLNLVHLNIRSLRTNFLDFVISIKPIIDLIDVIVLVETNICPEESDLYMIDGFCSYFKSRSERRGGGLGVFIKENILHEIVYPNNNAFESILLKASKNNIQIPVLAIYRPPALTSISTFIRNISETLKFNKLNKNLIIVGDINVDINKNSAESGLYLDYVNSVGLCSCNSSFTREDIKRSTKTNIDHILARLRDATLYSGTITLRISDHFSVFLSVEFLNQRPVTPKDSNRRLFIDNKKVAASVEMKTWNIKEPMDGKSLYNYIVKEFAEIYQKASIIIKKKKRRSPYPWLNSSLISMCAQRDKLFRFWKKKTT